MHNNRQLLERRSKCKKNTEVVSIAISFSVCTSIFGAEHMIVYSIFALYRDTENIHSNMMIWLVIFIISNYSLASSPPKVPGGVKRDIFSESRTLIHRAFSVNRKYQTRFQKSGICIFILCALSATRSCVFSCQKRCQIQ